MYSEFAKRSKMSLKITLTR